MKAIFSASCAIIFGVVLVLVVTPAVEARSSRLLGARECTWGPSYWCSNITNAKNCHAVRHCIQTVWEKQKGVEDTDSICQICLDMVKQARDQLESNQTQDDIKAVFEGSCKLIPIKPVRKECVKLADDFIPELIEALASQMNPQVVCSVAGLCNNDAIDKQLAELAAMPSTTTMPSTTPEEPKEDSISTQKTPAVVQDQLSCSGCNNIATIISNKFQSANRDDILENMLRFCGTLSSYSDACANIALAYFNDIYDQLKESLNSDSICHVSGVCATKYHQHPEMVEIRPLSNVGVIPVKEDIPCELCEQLVRHLRDVLIANTTEEEFKFVLEGLCKQTGGFKEECLSIVDQYYDKIYQTLVDNLDANGACFMIGICPKGLENEIQSRPIMPLLPSFPPQRIEVSIKEIPKKKILGENEPKLTNEEIQSAQLPIDKLLGPQHADLLVENGQLCTLCEYFLHFVQEALSTPSNEEKIKQIVSSTCDKMPSTIRAECHKFVETYGDAVIALLIQDIDPGQVCPTLKMCPQHVDDMEVFAPQPIDVSIEAKSTNAGDKPTCPLCLFAVKQAQEKIKSDKTTENIRQVLDNLCVHLPKNLKDECVDFVDTYSKELIQMLVTDFTAEQICVYIKLCPDSKPDLSELNIQIDSDEDLMTNEIPDNTINGQPADVANREYFPTPECMLCQRIIKEVEKRVINSKSKEQIKHALEHACDTIHDMKVKCRRYVDEYSDRIIDLLMIGLSPKTLCRSLELCIVRGEFDDLDIDEALKIDVIAIPSNHPVLRLDKMTGLDDIITAQTVDDGPQCVMCEFAMAKLEQELHDKKTQDEIKQTVQNICKKMPKTVAANCKKFVDDYADLIINLLDTVPPKQVCQKIGLCPNVLEKITDEVIECGVCHGTVSALYPYVKSKSDNHELLEHHHLVEEACNTLPKQYYEKCEELINYYGESITNLINFGTGQSEICAEIGKCFKEERSIWAFQKLSSDTDILKRNRRSANSQEHLVGAEMCTRGPAYWCISEKNANECGTFQYCTEKEWSKSKTK